MASNQTFIKQDPQNVATWWRNLLRFARDVSLFVLLSLNPTSQRWRRGSNWFYICSHNSSETMPDRSKQHISLVETKYFCVEQNWPPGKKNCLSGRGAILITIKAILNFKSCKMKFSGVSSSLRLRRHATLSSLSLPSRLPTCAHPSHHDAHLHHNLLCTLVRNYKPPIHPLNSE